MAQGKNKEMIVSQITWAAFVYAFTTPLMIWAGIVLSQGDYKLGIILVIIVTIIDFFGTKLWIKAQTDAIKK